MVNMLISACLDGNSVRYDGSSVSVINPDFLWIKQHCRIFTFCPEISAGLPIPRAPAEIENDDGLAVLNGTAAVIDKEGNNVAYEFISGALNTLEFCQERSIRYAILTESSPSCGSTMIYDGSFQGVRKRGQGVTAVLLRHHGIHVYSQNDITLLRQVIEKER